MHCMAGDGSEFICAKHSIININVVYRLCVMHKYGMIMGLR